jgi:predicted component of type VI protein secretion system
VIGRDPGCDVMVTGAHVSRRHAEFSLRSGQLWVKDLGSSNGTFVNGKRNDEVALKNGDEVKFDAMTFKVVGPAGAAVEESFDEADMTQFRPAVSAKPAAASAAKPAAAPAPKPASAPVAAPKPALTPAPAPILASAPIAPKAVAAPAAATAPAQSTSGGGIGPLVLVVLVVLAAVAGFFIFR